MSDRPTNRIQLTQQFVKECFDYANGDLIWRNRPVKHFRDEWAQKVFNNRQAGTKAGSATAGYLMVNFYFGKISAHRLVFLWHHGQLPVTVDHIDGNPMNNRIENLRPATHAENSRNCGISVANTSGVRGVSFHKPTRKWAAHIRAEGKMKHLGLFVSLDDAAAARRAAEQAYYGGFARG